MVSAALISTCALVLAVFQPVVGDVITVPALGIANGGVDVTEDDVQPFTGFNTPCGTIDVAKNIDTSTAVLLIRTTPSMSSDIALLQVLTVLPLSRPPLIRQARELSS